MAPAPHYRAFGTFRLLLALAVVISHSVWMLAGTGAGDALIGARIGTAAVFCFFVLSGFIMSEAAASFYADRPGAFVRNRFLKIFPPFGAALVVSIAVHVTLVGTGRLLDGIAFEGYGSIPEAILSAGNLVFNALSALPFLSPERGREVIGSDIYLFVRYIWAVKVEVAFYLAVLGFIAFRKSVEPLLVDRLGWALAAFTVLYALNGLPPRFSYELQFAPYFLLGIGLYLTRRGHEAGRLTLAFGAALSFIHAAWFTGPSLEEFTLKSCAAMLLLGLFVLCIPALARVRLSLAQARIDRRLGDLSYALYLNHYAVLVAFSALTPEASLVAAWPVLLAAAVAVSAVMQWLVERPLARLRDRLRGRAILADTAPAPAAELAPSLRPQ